MAVDMTAFRRFGAFNAAETNDELKMYTDAAVETLTRAGVAERTNSPLYNLTVYQLATIYHDNRGALSEGPSEVPYGLQSAVHQLRNAEPETTMETTA